MKRSFLFDPDKITVESGTTVVFRFHNTSSVGHEAYIGDEAAQSAHEQVMARLSPGRKDVMNDPNGVEVAPGATTSLSYHVTHPGTLILGCHELGHYAGGMKATITVT